MRREDCREGWQNRRLVRGARRSPIALFRSPFRHLNAAWFVVGRGAIDAVFVEWRAITLRIQRHGPNR